jgi:hypothetical protein
MRHALSSSNSPDAYLLAHCSSIIFGKKKVGGVGEPSSRSLAKEWQTPVGDPNAASRCGAKTRRGTAYQSPAVANERCRMRGGAITGPRSASSGPVMLAGSMDGIRPRHVPTETDSARS